MCVVSAGRGKTDCAGSADRERRRAACRKSRRAHPDEAASTQAARAASLDVSSGGAPRQQSQIAFDPRAGEFLRDEISGRLPSSETQCPFRSERCSASRSAGLRERAKAGRSAGLAAGDEPRRLHGAYPAAAGPALPPTGPHPPAHHPDRTRTAPTPARGIAARLGEASCGPWRHAPSSAMPARQEPFRAPAQVHTSGTTPG